MKQKNPFDKFDNLGQIKNDLNEYEHLSEDEAKDILEENEEQKSFLPLFLILIFIVLLLVGRLFQLQIISGLKNAILAQGNRVRLREIEAPRGIIYDKNLKPLVKNIANYSLEIYPLELPIKKDEKERVLKKVSETTGISFDDLVSKTKVKTIDPVVLIDNLERDKALDYKIKLNDLVGVSVQFKTKREYDFSAGLAHLTGYIGKITENELKDNPDYRLTSEIGKSGLEKTYQKDITGKPGAEQIEVDSKGQVQRILADSPAIIGNNLVLNLDLDLQKKIGEDLTKTGKQAVAVAINPQDGGILAMVSLPDYNQNIFINKDNAAYQQLLNDPDKPLINRAIQGQYPAGSTIKPMIALAGLQENIINENTTINDPGEISIGQWKFPDWKAHGKTDLKKAIAESCDVFFYGVGGGYNIDGIGSIKGLGIDKIDLWLNKFGFGNPTKIDLVGEGTGLVPTMDWKKKKKKESWYIGDTYHVAIGQGDFLTTPLQLADAITFIANGGKLFTPHLGQKITDQDGQEIRKIETGYQTNLVSDYNLNLVRSGMRQTVLSGSGKSLGDLADKFGKPVAVAGKTGTAQFGTEDKTHSWFVSFAPYDNPQIALVVLVEGGGEGNETAVPISKDILNWYFNR